MSSLSTEQLSALVRSGQLSPQSARQILRAVQGQVIQMSASIGQQPVALTATRLSKVESGT